MMYISREDKLDKVANLDHQALYQRLMMTSSDSANVPYLAQMVASWVCGRGGLPRFMGLDEESFGELMRRAFPGIPMTDFDARQSIEPDRASELEDVQSLLIEHRSSLSDEEIFIAQIVATGCMGSDHLWADLGLFARKDLGQMLLLNFRPLAELNVNNMRWKKFFYRQLCAKEGFILCRSPSCETCCEYSVCFAPEGA